MAKSIERKTWKEFHEAGLLWWINRILHTFRWSIVIVKDEDGVMTECYPARTRYQGFYDEDEKDGFEMISKHIKANAERIVNFDYEDTTVFCGPIPYFKKEMQDENN